MHVEGLALFNERRAQVGRVNAERIGSLPSGRTVAGSSEAGCPMPTEIKGFEYVAYYVGGYVTDVVLRSGRKKLSPEEIAMIVERALDTLRGREAEAETASTNDTVTAGTIDGRLVPR